MPKVLIVEDEAAMATALEDGFRYEGYEVSVARDGGAALRMLSEIQPDLVILDVMLPKMSGLDVCREARRAGNPVPIIMLTARGQEIDKVLGLKLGADDYITKPFSLEELLARIEAVLRRVSHIDRGRRTITIGDLTVDQEGRDVVRADQRIEMSRTEFNVLEFLVLNVGRVVSKQQILEHVWQYDFGGESTVVETYISYLRKKLDPLGPPLIHTLRGVGYVFRAPAED